LHFFGALVASYFGFRIKFLHFLQRPL